MRTGYSPCSESASTRWRRAGVPLTRSGELTPPPCGACGSVFRRSSDARRATSQPVATSYRHGPRLFPPTLHLHGHRAVPSPIEQRSQEKTVLACQQRGTFVVRELASRPAADSRRQARPKNIAPYRSGCRSPSASESSPPADTPSIAVRLVGNATSKRDLTQDLTSSMKNLSCAANRAGSNRGEYSCSRNVSSATRCTPTIMVGGRPADSSAVPHCAVRCQLHGRF